jgi:hypothetical protein
VRSHDPYDTYRLYQIERAKSSAEIQRADEQAARFASALSWLFGGIMRRTHPVRMPYPAAGRGGTSRRSEPVARRGTMAGATEGS